jgi:hypothetical protein
MFDHMRQLGNTYKIQELKAAKSAGAKSCPGNTENYYQEIEIREEETVRKGQGS